MRITTQGEYGLRCMLLIAQHGDQKPVSAQEITEHEHLPRYYVEKLLQMLRRDGLIKSVRGIKGGYVLARPASEVTVRDVVFALEKQFFEVACPSFTDGKVQCLHIDLCGLRPVWVKLYEKVNEVLQEANLQLLLQEEQRVMTDLGVRSTLSEVKIALAAQHAGAAKRAPTAS